MSVLRAVSSVWCCSVAAALVGVAVPGVAWAEGGEAGPGKSAASAGEKECDEPKPEPAPKLDGWPGDIFSCDPRYDVLCPRGGPVGAVVAGIGIASLGVGLGMNLGEAGSHANPSCEEAEPGTACPGESGPHALYGPVATNTYLADGASTARGASDGILYGSIGVGSFLTVIWGRRYAAAFAASIGFTSLTTEVIKVAAANPRPIAWMTQADVDALPSNKERKDALSKQAEKDSYRSFPSGHTSMTAAATTSLVTIWSMHMAEAGDPIGLACVLGLGGSAAAALTVGVAVLRVDGGAHHPPDVLVGGLIGTAMGIGIPFAVLGPSRKEAANPRHTDADILDPSTFALGVDDSQVKLSGQW